MTSTTAAAAHQHLQCAWANLWQHRGWNCSTASTCRQQTNCREGRLQRFNPDTENYEKPLEGFHVLFDDDPTALAIGCGGSGHLGHRNALPAKFSDIAPTLFSCNSTHQQLNYLHPLLYVDGNQAVVKAYLHLPGLCENNKLCLPLKLVTEAKSAKLKYGKGENGGGDYEKKPKWQQ